jgi:hypothetical protein
MFVIEASKQDLLRWISGIFRERADAESYVARIPENLRRWQRLYEISFSDYPLYLVEAGGFRFVAFDALEATLRGIDEGDGTVEAYMIAYKIEKDFAPRRPGADVMGLLEHVHVDDRFLRYYRAEGPGANPFGA